MNQKLKHNSDFFTESTSFQYPKEENLSNIEEAGDRNQTPEETQI